MYWFKDIPTILFCQREKKYVTTVPNLTVVWIFLYQFDPASGSVCKPITETCRGMDNYRDFKGFAKAFSDSDLQDCLFKMVFQRYVNLQTESK